MSNVLNRLQRTELDHEVPIVGIRRFASGVLKNRKRNATNNRFRQNRADKRSRDRRRNK
jgi:hypothetical protein